MAAGRWRTRFRLGAVLFAIFIQVINGYEDIYTISQLSPKSISADEFLVEEVLETSRTPHLEFNIEPSIYMPDEDEEHDKIDIDDNEEENEHVIVARSADPMRDRQSRSINIDEIVSSQNNDIDNDIELHNKRKYYEIHPTKSLDYLRDRDDVILSSEGFGDKLDFRFPGEGQRVPRGRALPPQGPKIHPTIVQPMFATATHRDQARQNSAEIQNIITGIVKLLNGNVNVQANSQLLNGRPERPTASRINNRGPPRISEAPLPPYPLEYEKPISAFEKPMHSFVPTKSPPPYPFDRPPHVGINLPEQIVPPIGPNPYRPGFHRPNRPPPWHRPRPRPNPNKRPSPNLPSYKPSVSTLHQNILPVDLPEETEDILTISENESNHSENNIHSDDKEIIPITSLDETTPEAEIVKEDDSKQTTVTNEVESKLETLSNTTTTSSSTTSTSTTTTTENVIETTKEEPTTTTEKITEKTTTSTTTEKIKEKPIKQEKDTNKKKESGNEKERQKDKYKIVEDKIVNKPKNETVTEQMIEPSIVDKPVTASIAPTPTEGLPPYTPEIIHYTNSSSIVKTSINSQPLPTPQAIPYEPYRPRPGIVLDDPDFKPKGTRHRPDAAVITATETNLPPGYGETFVVTVSAIQGPGEGGGASVHIENIPLLGEIAHGDHDIIVSPSGDQGFVSINGEKSYINIFGDDSSTVADIKPTAVHRPPPKSAPPPHIGTGIAIPADDLLPQPAKRPPQVQQRPAGRPPTPSGYRKPQPTVRIDTCIVGDDSTCDRAQNEKCRTEVGISSCQCRPGYARRNHRDPCRRVVSLVLNVRVDKLYDRTVAWNVKLADKESEQYQKLSYEALRAIDSAFSMTRFSDDFVGGVVNSVHNGDQYYQGVYVNYTILMQESPETLRTAISTEIESQLLGVIRRRRNNIGQSALYVDTPHASVVPPSDLDECSTPDLNDCHKLATCTNTWGGFRCACSDGTRDAFPGELYQSGRECQSCANSHCNDRGTCRYANNQPYCSCSSGYYGSTCEVDGEVVGVAVGASLAAALVIALTLAALMSWSRKWSREQKAAGMGSPVFNYMAANTIKTPPVGQPPYQVTLEERMRWAQIAEAMAANHYAQAESAQAMATRPSSAMFGGYPTLPPVPMPRMGIMSGHHTGTLNTVASRANTAASHHNMYGYINHAATESTSSEASSHVQERADLLVPRPKSRARSMHNQTGIYYDVDYENAPEAIYGTKGIPLSTYTVSRGPPFYRT